MAWVAARWIGNSQIKPLGKIKHALDGLSGTPAGFRVNPDFVRAGFQHMGKIGEAIHRHPRAMGA